MSARSSLSTALLLSLVTACLPRSSTAPAPLKPSEGPQVSVRVSYSGGLIHRTLDTWVRAEDNSYVMVGHLGGDGVLRVLYPSTPRQRGYVREGKSLHLPRITADYDGLPYLFAHAVAPLRGVSSAMDSYDGRGHGFVFAIASRRPLDFSRISDGLVFDDFEIEDYRTSFDPRRAIRAFADLVAVGSDFTLRYASSYTSMAMYSYAQAAWDCALVESVYGLHPFYVLWGAPSPFFLLRGQPYNWYLNASDLSRCGGSPFSHAASYAVQTGPTTFAPPAPPTGPRPPVGDTTTTESSPLRPPGESSGTTPRRVIDVSRSGFDRPSPASRRNEARERRTLDAETLERRWGSPARPSTRVSDRPPHRPLHDEFGRRGFGGRRSGGDVARPESSGERATSAAPRPSRSPEITHRPAPSPGSASSAAPRPSAPPEPTSSSPPPVRPSGDGGTRPPDSR